MHRLFNLFYNFKALTHLMKKFYVTEGGGQ